MAEFDNFTAEDIIDPSAWENLDEKQITQEVTGLTSRIRNVTNLLDKMVYNNDYDNTEKEFRNLYSTDLTGSGFVPLFINNNKDAFAKYPEEAQCPPWYSGLSLEKKKIYDQCHRYYIDLSRLVKPMELLSRLMMAMQLKDSFQFMRTTLNFDEAGYSSDMFHKIRDDCTSVAQLLSRIQGSQGSKVATARDYKLEMTVYKLTDHFNCSENGTVTVNPGWQTDMNVIDRYTRRISSLPNIEDNMKKTQDALAKVSEALAPLYNLLKSNQVIALMDALYKLKDAIYEYTVGGLNVWNCYKNRDDDSPYCFVKMMPTFQGNLGFEPITEDPWHSGTSYGTLYKNAAGAMTYQCQAIVKGMR